MTLGFSYSNCYAAVAIRMFWINL